MLELELKDFDIDQIANSGQCFRMYKVSENSWDIFAVNEKVNIQKKTLDGKKVHIFDCSEEKFYSFWFNYFDLQTDYTIFKRRILSTNDTYLCQALNFGYGLRILRQDVWEMVVSFVISQQNNIPRIKNCLNKLCELNNGKLPRPVDLLKMNGEKLKSVKLGYREDYLLQISEKIIDRSFSIDDLRHMSYVEAMKYLMSLRGVGEKVANCIALFGLYHIEAFPIDVWIKKIIMRHYNGKFCLEKMGLEDIGGIVQQYMYFFERRDKVV